ncbi:MAG: cobalamin biosynthesis protein, partial [Lachnospiraceae bacterium]|nr:cobalamin biosynthesis protein [Lachnospiraceae bacterium]
MAGILMEKWILLHLLAVLLGTLLDLLIGDPEWVPHPVRLMGRLIGALEKKLLGEPGERNRNRRREFHRGIFLWIFVMLLTAVTSGLLLYLAFRLHWLVWFFAETVLTCYVLAARNLSQESRRVYLALKERTLPEARAAVARIVGRDT